MNIQCTQCGGSVQLPEGARFVICPYCSSALYLDRSKVVFHFVISPTITQDEASGKLRRWMAGNETVKDLDVHAAIQQQEMLYFPMWRFVVHEPEGDHEYNEPASSFAISEIKNIPLSGGNLKFFSPQEFQGIILKQPDVLLESAINWLVDQHKITRDRIAETNLIHIPFYIFRYAYKGTVYQAVVEAISGSVLASVYPAKDEVPFYGIAFIAIVTFFVIGLIAPNFLIRLILFVIAAVPFALIANGVVKKY